jgi:hypothetical protein
MESKGLWFNDALMYQGIRQDDEKAQVPPLPSSEIFLKARDPGLSIGDRLAIPGRWGMKAEHLFWSFKSESLHYAA